ncbi:MAG: NAD(P)/FAD-dependent oxidoreductase [Deltaproteobacteria bacterium]|nr:NAD(P)/FAD-dependent oxidoreductase [Deltaproteobacteria bacterium]
MTVRYVHPATTDGDKIILIIGAGFAGLNAAKALAHQPGVQVILIDKKNHHVFQPLLYQVATAALNPSDIAMPIRSQFTNADRVAVHWGVVTGVNLKDKYVTACDTSLAPDTTVEIVYDYLIVACGAQHSYFGHPEWEPFAPGLKTLEHATEIRRRYLAAFERAENIPDPEQRVPYLTFVVVGAGPTGVELAGAMAEISKTVIVDDFHHIDPSQARVVLIEAGPRVLSAFSDELSRQAERDLKALGVEVLTSTRVENVGPEGVIANGTFIPSHCVSWAAGVEASKLQFTPQQKQDRAGRILVTPTLSLPEFPEVFVVGDMAAVEASPGKFVPGLAPAAIQQGKCAAKNIAKLLKSQQAQSFHYLDKGMMATIGKKKAVVEAGKVRLSGLLAWLGWLLIHVLYLVGFKNRVAVLLQWVWSYVFSKRGARLITDEAWQSR